MDRSWEVIYLGPLPDEERAKHQQGDRVVWVSGREHPQRPGLASSTFWVRAQDATAAEEVVRHAIGKSATAMIRTTKQLPYWMFISIPEEDAEPINRARVGRLGLLESVITSEPSDGFAELLLEVLADADEAAAEEGLEVYRDLRLRVGLPPHPDPRFRLNPPWPGRLPQRRHRVLLEQAQTSLERGDYVSAVVIAQAAFEVLVDQAMLDQWRALDIEGLGVLVRRHIKTCSLSDKHTRRLWDELMGDDIGNTKHWLKYMEDHIQRRNAIVHTGESVGGEDARQSVEGIEALIEHVEALPSFR
jgi:hypothetical protein